MKLTRKEKVAQLTLLQPHSGTVVPARTTYHTPTETIADLHAQLLDLYRILNKYQGRYLPKRSLLINAALEETRKLLNHVYGGTHK